MQVEVGNILEGKVTGITKFGAFVELPGGKTGMVHISEVASSYVKEITDHLSRDQVVKVKVIGITPDGKISLSIKQAAPAQEKPVYVHAAAPSGGGSAAPAPRTPRPPRRAHYEQSYGFERRQAISSDNMSFEDMLSKFKQTSDDKMSDLKKTIDVKRGSSRRGRP